LAEVIVAGCGPGAVELIAPAVFDAARKCDIVIGPERLLKYFEAVDGEKKLLKGNYREILDWIIEHIGRRSILVLVTGDPLIHSFGKMVAEQIDNCRIIPGISSIHYALTKVGRSWEGVKIISLHGKVCPDLAEQIKIFSDLAILTDGEETAKNILNTIRQLQLQERRVYLCENLSLETESIRIIHPEKEIPPHISSLNLILVLTDGSTHIEN
jgi:precorrin-6y C5,15-methyltransferase (decarboxylating) CbiE subunit